MWQSILANPSATARQRSIAAPFARDRCSPLGRLAAFRSCGFAGPEAPGNEMRVLRQLTVEHWLRDEAEL